MANDLELKLRITGDAKSGIEAFGAIKAGVTATKEAAQAATGKVKELVQAANAGKLKMLADAQKDADATAAKIAAAKRELEYFKRQAEVGGADGMKVFGRDIGAAQSAIKKASLELVNHNAKIEQIRTTAATALPAYTKGIEAAKKEAGRLKEAAEAQAIGMEKARRALTAQGVDVTRLAAEYRRLTVEAEAYQKKAALLSGVKAARETLGVRAHDDVSRDIDKQRAAYEALRASGKLTAAELAQAHVAMRHGIVQLRHETNGWGDALLDVRARLVGVAVAVGGVALAGKASFDVYKDFSQRMAEVNTVTDVTPERLKAISGEVRELSLRMGRDATQSAAALYDILSSGVPEQNGIKVLALATKAAVAGVTETKIAAQVGVGVMNAYGASIDQLPGIYDRLFQTVKDGVVTFPELAQSIGDVLPIASATGTSLAEVGAAIAQMTQDGIKAPKAITALTGAITQLSTPGKEAQEVMDQLGIRWNGLTGTLQQIVDKKVGQEALRTLVPDIEGRTAVIDLTKHFDGLKTKLESMDGASGAMGVAYEKMRNTPQQRIDDFNAAMGDLKITMGEAASALLPLVQGLSGLLNAFNGLPEPLRVALAGLVGVTAAWATARITLLLLKNPLELIGGKFLTAAAAAGASTKAVGFLGQALNLLGKSTPWLIALSLLASAGVAMYQRWAGASDEAAQTEKDNAQAVSDKRTALNQKMAMLVERLADKEKQSAEATAKATAEAALAAQKEILEGQKKSIAEQIAGAEKLRTELIEAYKKAGEAADESRKKAQDFRTKAADKRQDVKNKAEDRQLSDLEKTDPGAADAERQLSAERSLQSARENMARAKAGSDKGQYADAAKYTAEVEKQIARAEQLAGAIKDAGLAQQLLDAAGEMAAQSLDAQAAAEDAKAAQADKQQKALSEQQAVNAQALAEFQAQLATVEAGMKALSGDKDAIKIKADQEALAQVKTDIANVAAELAKLPDQKTITITTVNATAPAAEIPAKATGGPISGPGTGTSDSVLIAASAGEHMITASEVQAAGGHGAIYRLRAALRAGTLPGYAHGGAITRAVAASLPRFAEGGPIFSPVGASASGANAMTVVLQVAGQSYPMQAAPAVAQDFAATLRRESLKRTG